MANNTKIDLDKQVLSLGESFEALWENINEKFTRKTDNTIPTRTVFVYKTSTSQPGKPIGGSWDNKNNTIVYPKNNPDDLDKEHTWGGADNIERPIWMSVKTFATEPAAETDWSLPTMISGENGAPGADGLSREFVYKLTKTEFEVPGGDDPDYAENLPSEQVNGYVPTGWSAHPTGISEEYRAEWQLTRTKQEDGTWSKWSGPFLWSRYGMNGQDGDSVEYIYKITNTATPPVIPGYDVDSDEYQGKGAYYGIEYIPDGWSDNPLDVNEEWMWCWVSQRKKKDNKWQAFSTPTLWAKYGETGKSGYTVMTLYKLFPIKDTYDVVANEVDTINNSFNDPDIEDINPIDMNWVSSPQFNDEMNLWAISGVWDLINNKLVDGEEWQGPYFVSAARTLSTPNFQINVFTQADFTVQESTNINNIADRIAKPEDGINYDDEFEDGEYVAVSGTGDNQIRTTWTLTPKGKVGTSADSNMWFTCVGVVNGVTRTVTWGEMNRYNAMDGDAGGKYIEYRYAASEHPDIQPETSMCWDEMGNPVWIPGHMADDGATWVEDWVLSDPLVQGKTIGLETQNYSSAIEASNSMSAGELIKVLETETITPEGGNSETYYPGLYIVVEPGNITKFRQYVWQIWAFKDLQKKEFLDNGWQGPVRISGEPGESIKGEVGPSGVPGANVSPLYMKGNADGPEIEWNDSLVHLEESALIAMGWNQTPPQVDAQSPYVWCTQAKMVWEYDENNTMVQKVGPDGWCTPFRMSGLNVMDQPGAITLYAVLDNPIDTVICDAEGNVPQSNLNIQTTFKVYKGTSEKYVKSRIVDGEVEGVEYTIENATLTVNRITSTEDKIYIPLRATVEDLGQELSYRTVFTISKIYAGAPTIAVDFGNENITVPSSTDGVLENNVYPIETSIHVYSGTTEINEFNVECNQLGNDDYSVEGGVLSISAIPGFTGDVALLDFDIIFTVDGKEYTKSSQLRIVKVKQGRDSIIYELSTNSNAIRRTQDNQLVPASLDVVVLKKTGDGNVTTLDMHQIQSFGKVVYSVDDSTFEDFPMSGSLTLDQSLDLEQKLELKLISNQDQNKYLDKDTLYLLHDGLPAVQYSLVVNRDVVQYDENGRVNDTSSIICDLVKVNGSSYEKVYGVPVGYDLEYSVDGGRSKPYIPSTAIAYNEFKQILEFRFYTVVDSERVLVDYDKVVVMKPTKGDRGRIIYPAGIYDPNKTYITDNEKAPYVLDSSDKKFYVLTKETSWNGSVNNGQTPSQNATSELVEPVWEAFEMFEAIYAQIGVFNQALVGSAVFFGEYVFSQSGRDAKGKPSTNYELFNPDDPYGTPKGEGFYPSICFNFVSGAFWLGGNKISYDPVENTINLKGVTMKWSDIEDLPEDFEKLATTAGQSATQAEFYAKLASESAKATNNRVDDWVNDSMISPTEQSALKDKKAEMTAEYNKIINDINNFNNSISLEGDYNVSTEGIESAYNKACAAIDYHSNPANEPVDNENVAIKDAEGDGDIRFSNIAAYYAALIEITDIYAKKSANYAEALANKYTDGEIIKSDQRTTDAIDKALEDAAAEAQKIVDNNKQSIINASVEETQKNIDTAKQDLTNELNTKAAELRQAITDGDAAAIAQANAALEKAKDAKDAVDALEGAIGDLEGSILSEGDVTNLSIAAIQEATKITGDTVASQTVIGRNIIGLAGTFAKIQAENIEGTTISGKTIQSDNNISDTSDPTWQIKNAGDGYLAQKNISWDVNGNLTVKGKINGSVGSSMGPWNTFASDSINYIGDGADYSASKNAFGSDGSFKLGGSQGITKDAAGKIVFGDNVTISWGDMPADDFGTIMSNWFGEGNKIDLSNTQGEISGTRITNGTISTEQIAAGAIGANQIAADAITADKITGNDAQFETLTAKVLKVGKVEIEKIVAEKIAAQEISTDKLETNLSGTGEGKVQIQDNYIKVYNNDLSSEILSITGGKLTDIPNQTTQLLSSNVSIGQGTWRVGNIIILNIGSYTPQEGYSWNATIGGNSFRIQTLSDSSDYGNDITFDICYTASTTYIDNSYSYVGTMLDNTTKQFIKQFTFNEESNQVFNFNVDTAEISGLQGGSTYYFYVLLELSAYNNNSLNISQISLDGNNTATFTPFFNRTDISNNGFRYLKNATHYIDANKEDKYIELRVGVCGLRIANDGLYYTKNSGGNWSALA